MLAFLVLSSFSVQGENCEFFECRDSSRVIPASFINDDFCDCPDGSDESSTSACLVGSFQCPEKIIHSSFVHDTICDCCDGSDEKTGLCPNRCQEFFQSQKASEKEKFDRWQRGMKLKIEQVVLGNKIVNEYQENLKSLEKEIKEIDSALAGLKALKSNAENLSLSFESAESAIDKMNEEKSEKEGKKDEILKVKDSDFGKFKEFSPLVGKKLEKDAGKYSYVVEFFKRAYQKEGSMEYSLGNWAGFEEDYSIIRYTGGTTCPNQVSRSLKVHLQCSDHLEFSDFKEVSMCTYEATVLLPAACKTSIIS